MYKTDTYLCEIKSPLNDLQRDILTYLYLPLIGDHAYSLYLVLYNEAKRMDRIHRPCALSRITSMLNLSIDHLEDASRMLEGIGLLKTYAKINGTEILFTLQRPLPLRMFLKNQVLMTLLKHTLGKEELHLTINYFRITLEDKTQYEEITSSFNDVYSVDLSAERPLQIQGEYISEEAGSFEVEYDLTLFYESLKDYAIPLKTIKQYDQMFKQIGVLYHIDAITLASLVRESFNGTQFDAHLFSEKARNYYKLDSTSTLSEVYRKQPDQLRTSSHAHNALEEHLKYLETISPYQLLKNKQGGSEPVLHDLSIAETLMTQLHLTPGVTNVLIEYVLGHNDNKLSRSYCETIGASWSRKHLKTTKEAYEEAMKMLPEKKEKIRQKEKGQEIKRKAEEKVDASHIDLDEMLASLNGGEAS